MTAQLSLFNDMPAKQIKGKVAKAQQLDLFSQAETAQFGVVSNPRMDISSGKLGMIIEDTRTEAQKEAAIEETAKSLTQQMF